MGVTEEGQTSLQDLGKRIAEPGQNKEALIKNLKKIAARLDGIAQEPDEDTIKTMKPCTDAVVLPGLLKHQDKEVRLLVATCIAEIIRIRAPHCPYEDDNILKDIFELIVETFRGLDQINSPLFQRRATILEDVASVKFCIVMLDLCDDLIVEMFKVFFAKTRIEHPQHVRSAMKNIMQLITLESAVPHPLLKEILLNLLKDESTAAHKLAFDFVQSCGEDLGPHVKRFMALTMTELKSSLGGLPEDYHDMIYGLYKCAPKLLIGVIPSLTEELSAPESVEVRLKAVELIGRLFALPGKHVAREYKQLFSEFLKRFTDKSVEVRLAVINCAKNCILAKPTASGTPEILSCLEERILDYDDKVRMQVVAAVCDIAKINLKSVPMKLLEHVATRLRDTETSVRKDTLHRLTEVYATHCSKSSDDMSALDEDLEWIPSRILRCCYDKDVKEFRPQGIELVLTEELFEHKLSVMERVKRWVRMFVIFDQNDRKALERVLSQKQRLQHEMQSLLSLRQKMKEEDRADMQKRVNACCKVIATAFVDSAKAEENIQKLLQLKDNNVFKAFSTLLDPNTTMSDAFTTRDELLKKIGEKHTLYEFIKMLAVKCSYILFGKEHVKAALNEVNKWKDESKKELLIASMNLLVEIAGFFPVLLEGTGSILVQLLKEEDDSIKEGIAHILAKAGASVREEITGDISSVNLVLEKLCLEGSRKQAKYGVSAIAEISEDSGLMALSVLYTKLLSAIESNAHLPTVFQSFGCISQIATSVFETREHDVICFIVRNVLQRSAAHVDENADWDNPSEECLLKVYGIKACVKSFLPIKDVQRPKPKGLLGVLATLFQHGEVSGEINSSDIDKAHLRLAAAKSVLRLSRHWDLQISAWAKWDRISYSNIFCHTVMTAQDPIVEVRKQFLAKTHQYLRERALNLKYACSFALCAVDSLKDPVVIESRQYLMDFIDTCRREARVRQANSGKGDAAPSLKNYPEYVLTYLIYVLAHHPRFPSYDKAEMEATDKERSSSNPSVYEPYYRQLLFFLRALIQQESEGGRADPSKKDHKKKEELENMPAIIEIFRTIKKAEDAGSIDQTKNMHLLCDIGLVITQDLGRKKLFPGSYPGDVPLPNTFYKISANEAADSVQKVDGSDLPACLTEDVFGQFRRNAYGGKKRGKRSSDAASLDEGEEEHDEPQQKKDRHEVAEVMSKEVKEMPKIKAETNARLSHKGKQTEKPSESKTAERRSKLGKATKEGSVLEEVGNDKQEKDGSSLKRKRGRPSKENMESAREENKVGEEVNEEASRVPKRGRPKKIKVDSQPLEVPAVSPSTPDKRRKAVEQPAMESTVEKPQRHERGEKSSGRKSNQKVQKDDDSDLGRKKSLPDASGSGKKATGPSSEGRQKTPGSLKDTPGKSLAEDAAGLEMAKKFLKKSASGEKAQAGKEEGDNENEQLVGRRIRVWWPLDKKFYTGKVSEYIAKTKKHKVVYDDGDEEVLSMAKEKWDFVDEDVPPKKGSSLKSSPPPSPAQQHGKLKKQTSINALVREDGSNRSSHKKTGSTSKAQKEGKEHAEGMLQSIGRGLVNAKSANASGSSTPKDSIPVASGPYAFHEGEQVKSSKVAMDSSSSQKISKGMNGSASVESSGESHKNAAGNLATDGEPQKGGVASADDKESDDEPLGTWRSRRRNVR